MRCVVLLQPDPAAGAGVQVQGRTGQVSGRNQNHKNTSLRGTVGYIRTVPDESPWKKGIAPFA